MAPTVGSQGGGDGTQMARVGPGGLALLPWTKHMLAVLWGQLRLLLQVIYYTFMSVFQMFRFEVHVSITDETGQHIQHMSTAANPSDSFLFSSLFEGDSSMMVSGSGHISNFCSDMGDPFTRKSTAEALLSTLRADELCCGLVDEFVSRTSGKEDVFGSQKSWKMGFTGDWNLFGSCSGDPSCKSTPEEDQSSPWSSEEDQNPFEFDNEESRNLWESLSGSNDPYNPFFFSACTSTRTNMGKQGATEPKEGSNKTDEEVLVSGGRDGFNILVSRSDSESSWGSSDGSTLSEDAEQLLEFFTSSDPYDPMCFTACSSTSHHARRAATSLPVPPTTDTRAPSSSEEDEEQLWKSLSTHHDPYHPLNFQACQQTVENPPKKTRKAPKATSSKPVLRERPSTHHHPETTAAPWTRPRGSEKKPDVAGSAQKKVRFSPVVRVHVMRSWLFARQASRKGSWEEMARDRERFQRRMKEVEACVGPCLSPAHRIKMRAYLDGALTL